VNELTPERVNAAYAALGSLDYDKAAEYWDEQVRWNSPGNHMYAGWHEGLAALLAFMRKVGEVSAGTWRAEGITVLVNPEEGWSADVSRTTARRAYAAEEATPYERLDITGIHLLRWRDGRIVEGRGALFEDGITNFNLWWSPVTSGHARVSQ
jgi:ketosteroid isomerase-like protein